LAYGREAIESVLAQSYRAWELIVVDDGSNDGTSAYLAQYDASVRRVSRQRRGVAAARNYGVGIARAGMWRFWIRTTFDGQETGNPDGVHGATP